MKSFFVCIPFQNIANTQLYLHAMVGCRYLLVSLHFHCVSLLCIIVKSVFLNWNVRGPQLEILLILTPAYCSVFVVQMTL